MCVCVSIRFQPAWDGGTVVWECVYGLYVCAGARDVYHVHSECGVSVAKKSLVTGEMDVPRWFGAETLRFCFLCCA